MENNIKTEISKLEYYVEPTDELIGWIVTLARMRYLNYNSADWKCILCLGLKYTPRKIHIVKPYLYPSLDIHMA